MKKRIQQACTLFLLAATIMGCSFSMGEETSEDNLNSNQTYQQTGATPQEAIEIQYEELGKLVTREFSTGGYYWFKVPFGMVSSKMRVALRHAGHEQYTYTGITGGYSIFASDGNTELVKNEGFIITYDPFDVTTADFFYIRVVLYEETPGSFGLYVGPYYDSLPSITTMGNPVVAENGTGMLGVKLSSPPQYDVPEVIVELSASSIVTLSSKKLTFDYSNWDTVQYIAYSVGAISDTSQKSEEASIYLEGLGTKELLSLSSEYGSKIYPVTIMKPIQWTQVTTSATFGGRYNHCSVVFNNKMWVMGGKDDSGQKSDVWSSTDGSTWTLATAAPGWSARDKLACTVYDNKMWIFGGYNNDVWNSVDGVTWNQVTAAAMWASRYEACALSYSKNLLDPDKMWIFGGSGYKDAWHSIDGVSWTLTTSTAPYSGFGHKCLVFADKMWVIGGNGIYKSDPANNTGYYIDVWSSTDGITWDNADPSENGYQLGQFKKYHASVVFENMLFTIGGERYDVNSSSTILTKDVFVSTDGSQWSMLANPAWTERRGHTAVVFDNKLWIIGGYANPSYSTHAQADVWNASF